jgi:uncharacterized membrane protein SpoIIM required for sporulation
MKQTQFEHQFSSDWTLLEQQLALLEKLRPGDVSQDVQLSTLPARYRRLCHHQALARERGYSLSLIQRLDDLVLRGHRQLYRPRLPVAAPMKQFFLADFPRAVRAQWPWQLASTLVFVLSLLLIWLLVRYDPDMVYSLLDPASTAQMEAMYHPQAEHRMQRDSGDDITMFGFYIYNNISIAFRTFAGGIFFGVGALFVMLFNGGYFGAVAAHLTNVGYHEPFFTFVIAHGAPELTAIVLAGGAGLRLGWALLAPGPWSRREALRRAASDAMTIMYGVFALLVLAAFIEAFWSPRLFPAAVKYSVGSLLWLLTLGYLLAGGRQR